MEQEDRKPRRGAEVCRGDNPATPPPPPPPPFTRLSGYSQLCRTALEDIPGTICFRQSVERGARRKRGSQICGESVLSANARSVRFSPPPHPASPLPIPPPLCGVIHPTGEVKRCGTECQQQLISCARAESNQINALRGDASQ